MGPAFRALASVLSDDVRQLRAEGYKVYRPQAFFLVSRPPRDQDWGQVFRETLTYDPATSTGLRQYPIFHPVKIGPGLPGEPSLASLAYPPGKGHWGRAHSAEDVCRFVIESFSSMINDLADRCPSVSRMTGGSGMSGRGNPR